MNPYASYLGSEDPLVVLRSTPARLQKLAQSMGESRIHQPRAPGKWSPREILVHLVDCELAFGFRYRQAIAEPRHTVQPFDQELWAKSYAVYSAEQALRTFAALRDWNLSLVRSLTPEQLAKSVSHPERGTMTVRTLIETAAGHDINHLRQLESVAGQSAKPS
jgi:DinB superfamily